MGVKNILRRLFCISCLYVFLPSCQKHIKDEYAEEMGCERFAGQYQMFDSANASYYNMIVSCIPGDLNSSTDSLEFQNYANLFDFKMPVTYGLNDPDHMSGTGFQPLVDKNGNSWTFSNVGYSGPNDRLNRVVGDSIYIRFTIDNSLYYSSDGVPYKNCSNFRNFGIKIH